MKVVIFLITAILVLPSQIFAQKKLKYKDIFPLLEAKNYVEAEPLLRKFLEDKKNLEEGSANLQMAYILHHHAQNASVVADSAYLFSVIDSAKWYYNNAISLIDEKEVKKSDDYYQEFNRRDLRSGEFMIKVSDIHLTIQDKIKYLDKRLTNARIIGTELQKLAVNYNESILTYKGLVGGLKDYSGFLLSCDETKTAALTRLISLSREMRQSQDKITQSIILIDNAGFRPMESKKPINDITKDGYASNDIYLGDFNFWDYGTWAEKALKTVQNTIKPLVDQLTSRTAQVAKILEKVRSGELVNTATFVQDVDISTLRAIETYDPQSVALQILDLQRLEANYHVLSQPTYEPRLRDSTQVSFYLKQMDTLNAITRNVGEILTSISKPRIEEGIFTYPAFFQKIGGLTGAEKMLSETKSWHEGVQGWILENLHFWTEKARWTIYAQDSIDLNINIDAVLTKAPFRFKPLALKVDENRTIFPVGINNLGNSLQGFVCGVEDSRQVRWMKGFELFTKDIPIDTLTLKSAFVESPEDRHTCYLFSGEAKGDHNFSMVHFREDGELIWNINLRVPNEPANVKYNEMLGETVIFLVEEKKLAQLTADQKGYIVVDRNGNIR